MTLSRRTLDTAAWAELEDSVERLGGKLHIERCDITDWESVEAVARMCVGPIYHLSEASSRAAWYSE